MRGEKLSQVLSLATATLALVATSAGQTSAMNTFDSVTHFVGPSAEQALVFVVNDTVRFRMIAVEGGSFQMGSTDIDAKADQRPAHQVTLSDYLIGETEVTQELWSAVMGRNPSFFRGKNLPVEDVSWHDCQSFVTRLNQLLHTSGRLAPDQRFHLPTEAQWEFAARGGNKSKGYRYAGGNDVDAVAWTRENAGDKTHPVATKAPNELGLYDMSGNVWEWCQDFYAPYAAGDQIDPVGPNRNTGRVLKRGGSWYYPQEYNFRPAYRYGYGPANSDYSIGMRLCLSASKEGERITPASD